MKQEDNVDHHDIYAIFAAPPTKEIQSIESEMTKDDRFTLYIFRGHCQSSLSEDRKEGAVIGFLRNHFRADITSVPDNVLKSCLQLYVCQDEESNLTNFGKIIEVHKIYRHHLKCMQDHLVSLRTFIRDQEEIIQNLMMRYDAGVIKEDINDENLDMVRKALALAQRCTLENYKLRQTIAKLSLSRQNNINNEDETAIADQRKSSDMRIID